MSYAVPGLVGVGLVVGVGGGHAGRGGAGAAIGIVVAFNVSPINREPRLGDQGS